MMKLLIVIKRASPVEGRTRKQHLRYFEELRKLAKINRKNQTKTEEIIWGLLRGKRLGYKFTRQKPIDRFVVDFYCSELLLVIEIDGGYHDKRKYYDSERDKRLAWRGIKVIRFSDKEIINDLEKVKKRIKVKIKKRKTKLS